METILFLIVIALVFSVFNLSGRIKRIEEKLSGAAREPTASKPFPPPAIRPERETSKSPLPAAELPTLKESWGSQFIEWIKEDWILKLGAFLVIIGFGWFVTYAFLNNWIGPAGRIALGIIAGILVLSLGWWRIKEYKNQGGVFLVLGSTIILLTIFAARLLYDFFTPVSALAVMFLSIAFVALASVKYRTLILALVSLVLAGVAPLIINAPATDHIGLFSYLFVVILGTLWIVGLTGWRELTFAGLVLVVFYSAPHYFNLFPAANREVLLLFAYAFGAVFFITNILGILKSKDGKIIPDLVTAGVSGLFLLAWILSVAPSEWQSLIISAWMLVFAGGAFAAFKATRRYEPFLTYVGVGIGMLAAATAIELDGAALTLAYIFESGAVALIAYYVLRNLAVAQPMVLLMVGPIVLSMESINSRAWTKGVFHEDFFVLFFLTAGLIGLGWFFRQLLESEGGDAQQFKFNAVTLVTGSIYAYILLWLSMHAALANDDTAVMISLAIYTVVGLAAYFYGQTNEQRLLRLYGAALLGFVVIRLIAVDVWKMELTGRIITFFIIGALLISTAFWGRRKRVTGSINQ